MARRDPYRAFRFRIEIQGPSRAASARSAAWNARPRSSRTARAASTTSSTSSSSRRPIPPLTLKRGLVEPRCGLAPGRDRRGGHEARRTDRAARREPAGRRGAGCARAPSPPSGRGGSRRRVRDDRHRVRRARAPRDSGANEAPGLDGVPRSGDRARPAPAADRRASEPLSPGRARLPPSAAGGPPRRHRLWSRDEGTRSRYAPRLNWQLHLHRHGSTSTFHSRSPDRARAAGIPARASGPGCPARVRPAPALRLAADGLADRRRHRADRSHRSPRCRRIDRGPRPLRLRCDARRAAWRPRRASDPRDRHPAATPAVGSSAAEPRAASPGGAARSGSSGPGSGHGRARGGGGPASPRPAGAASAAGRASIGSSFRRPVTCHGRALTASATGVAWRGARPALDGTNRRVGAERRHGLAGGRRSRRARSRERRHAPPTPRASNAPARRRPSTSISSTGALAPVREARPHRARAPRAGVRSSMRQQLTKATVEVLAGSRAALRWSRCSSTRPNTASSTPPASGRPLRPASTTRSAVRQRQRAGPHHGPAVRHLHRRRRGGRVGADPPAHGVWCASTAISTHRRPSGSLGRVPLPGGHREDRQRFTMFLADGTPVRATPRVTFKQYQTIQEQLEHPRRNSADKSTRHELSRDESLWGSPIANTASRAIGADRPANRIDKPRRMAAATVLVLPPLEESDVEPARA